MAAALGGVCTLIFLLKVTEKMLAKIKGKAMHHPNFLGNELPV
jgi:hypothetical protein